MKDSNPNKLLETKQRTSMGTDAEEEQLNPAEDHKSSLQVHSDNNPATSALANDCPNPKTGEELLYADGYSRMVAEQDDTTTEMMSSVGSTFFRTKKKQPLMEEEPSRHGDLDAEGNAMKRYRQFLDRSTLGAANWDYPSFKSSELILGKFLGNGQFSMVEEIRGVKFSESSSLQPPVRQRSNSIAIDDKESRMFIAQHCIRPSGDSRYALKRIRSDLQEDPNHCAIATSDLLLETYFLQHLQHAHIIKLRAMGQDSGFYFLVLDRLYDTLATRMQKWKDDKGFFVFFRNRRRQRERLEERLLVAFYMSSALRYLHEHKVIHRDIKPENLGFDVVSTGLVYLHLDLQIETVRVSLTVSQCFFPLALFFIERRYQNFRFWPRKRAFGRRCLRQRTLPDVQYDRKSSLHGTRSVLTWQTLQRRL